MPVSEYYQKNKEKLREYNKLYLRKYRLENSREAEYEQQKPRNSKYQIAYRKSNELRNKKYKARQAVRNAILANKMQRLVCEKEDCVVIGQGHHDDYDKPLDVRWLCRKHHFEEHQTKIGKEIKL
jgi:hypothetical protein